MKKFNRDTIIGAILCISIFLILGCVGAMETNTATAGTYIAGGVGLVLMVLAWILNG